AARADRLLRMPADAFAHRLMKPSLPCGMLPECSPAFASATTAELPAVAIGPARDVPAVAPGASFFSQKPPTFGSRAVPPPVPPTMFHALDPGEFADRPVPCTATAGP